MAPVKQKLEGSKKYVKHYRGAQGVTGSPDEDFVYTSFTNAALGSTPYLIMLDRPTRTVVLSIRGTSSYEDMITDLIDRPVDISDWVPRDLKQEHGIEGAVKAHAGMFSAAKAVLQDLNRHQILQILLRGEPLAEESRQEEYARYATDERDAQAPGWEPSRHSRPCRAPAQSRDMEWSSPGRGATPRQHAHADGVGGACGGRAAGRSWGEAGEEAGARRAEPRHWPQHAQQTRQREACGDPVQQHGHSLEQGSERQQRRQHVQGGEAGIRGQAPCRIDPAPASSTPKQNWSRLVPLPFRGRGTLLSSNPLAPSTPGAASPPGSHPSQRLTAAGQLSRQGWLYPPGGWVGLLSHPMLGGRVCEASPATRCFPGYAEAVAAERRDGGTSHSAAAAEPAGVPERPGKEKGAAHAAAHRGRAGNGTVLGAPSAGDGQLQAEDREADEEEEEGPRYYEKVLGERGLDCKGWNLVVVGHSLGAAVASFVGMHFKSWCPGVKVWAFNPPGGMITANLSHAMHDFVTSIIVGKDIVSRTGTVTFERLIDQVIVALARTRLSKMRILLQSKSKSVRKAATSKLFYPVEEIPGEALNYVRGYFESKCKFRKMFVPMFPPGRAMQLRRLKDGKGQESWDAVWIRAEQVMEEGILLSSNQSSDHYTARLTQVFTELLQ